MRDLEHLEGSLELSLQDINLEPYQQEVAIPGSKKNKTRIFSLTTRSLIHWLQPGSLRFTVERARAFNFRQAQRGKSVSFAKDFQAALTNAVEQDLLSLDGVKVRRVLGEIQGNLSIRQLNVVRSHRLEVDFLYPKNPASSSPVALFFRLKKKLKVPLSEHEIQARNAEGHLDSRWNQLAQQAMGDTAFVRGGLAFLARSKKSSSSSFDSEHEAP
ncbi:MAG: hypothetical protein MK135_00295 [Polyangiaceae bacterium]|nr:hypothetical protein [Polyangiaceae bacterium]